jgi:hypothetical protein
MSTNRDGGLLAWQWRLYSAGHRDRRNLLVHALTVPAFVVGTGAVAVSPWLGWWTAAGAGAAALAVALQGRSHRLERTPPVPFSGPLDVVARLLAEQWVTFPRFVLSGAFGRAWHGRAEGR